MGVISEIGMGRCVEVGLLVALCLATHAFASVHHLDADNNVVPIGAAKAVDDALATDREGTGHSGAVVLQSTATAKHGAKYSARENHQKHVAWAKGLNEGKHGGIAKYGIAAKDFKNPQDPQAAAEAKQKAEAEEAAARKRGKAEAAAADKAKQEKKGKAKTDKEQAKEKQQAAATAAKEKSAAAVARAKDDARADVATRKATKNGNVETSKHKVAKPNADELQLKESLLSGNKSLYHVYNWDLKFSNKSAPPLNPNATSAGAEIPRLNPMLVAQQAESLAQEDKAAAQVADAERSKATADNEAIQTLVSSTQAAKLEQNTAAQDASLKEQLAAD